MNTKTYPARNILARRLIKKHGLDYLQEITEYRGQKIISSFFGKFVTECYSCPVWGSHQEIQRVAQTELDRSERVKNRIENNRR